MVIGLTLLSVFQKILLAHFRVIVVIIHLLVELVHQEIICKKISLLAMFSVGPFCYYFYSWHHPLKVHLSFIAVLG